MAATLDVFICHAWRFHQEWQEIVDMIDSCLANSWRNFSLPWHDPAISTSSAMGQAMLEKNLVSQMISVDVVVVPVTLMQQASAVRWLLFETTYAVENAKTVVVASKDLDVDLASVNLQHLPPPILLPIGDQDSAQLILGKLQADHCTS